MKLITFAFAIIALSLSGCNSSTDKTLLTKREFSKLSDENQMKIMEENGISSFSEMNLRISQGKIKK